MAQILEIEGDGSPAPTFLEPYIQSGMLNFLIGSGASFPAIRTAGNIEAELNDLLASDQGEAAANAKCLEFLETIDAVHEKIVADADDENIRKVVEGYSRFASLIDAILFARKNVLLARQATIFTTNYDMLLEHAAAPLPGIVLNDGFDRRAKLNESFIFSPERYFDRTYRSGPVYRHNTEIPTINLVKLHGSLSWRRQSETVVYDPTAISKLTPEQRKNDKEISGYLQKHFLILPNFRKFHTTLLERIYYDLLRLFSKAMDQENALLCAFGFSFADEHLLDITRRSLRNPTSHLVIICYDRPSVTGYESKFAKHRNVTIIAPKQGVIDFVRFNSILARVAPQNES